ncbi:hypothetical protein CARUB_v10028297mg [Capsella rubella]|uniref:Prolamin-like domain-containing protein n=1 Tax=Capsella rubella TaxID=81985 RepID=R0F115_9BRAS|nr:uncharacterized protein LOC17875396 [Capsella rubella]EOA14951.1 hypothetical protein CARUB_v10028297mg [Capsella rubella]
MWINKFFFLLSFVCMAIFSTSQPLPSPPQPIPSPQPLPTPQPFQVDCWSSLEVIPDCVPEIFRSITNGKFGNVGPSCCHAFMGLDADCIPQMFVFAPLFPPSRSLKDHCSQTKTVPP